MFINILKTILDTIYNAIIIQLLRSITIYININTAVLIPIPALPAENTGSKLTAGPFIYVIRLLYIFVLEFIFFHSSH